jgi:class 3 adenylate cyclase
VRSCPTCGEPSPDEARFCQSCGEPFPHPQTGREARKTVTVVFADVKGSTELGERLDPETTRRVMTRYFREMASILEGHGGSVEKFIGDAVMAVFGVPAVHEDDALRAVRAASKMRTALASLNEELDQAYGLTLEVRIGINTGEVVSGDLATGQTLVTGDAVNVAARLEQAATPGDILLGESTYRLVRDVVAVEPAGVERLRGKEEPVASFRLVEVREGDLRAARGLTSPIVGRTGELAQRSGSCVLPVHRAGNGRGGQVTLVRGGHHRPGWTAHRSPRALPPLWGGHHLLAGSRGGVAGL